MSISNVVLQEGRVTLLQLPRGSSLGKWSLSHSYRLIRAGLDVVKNGEMEFVVRGGIDPAQKAEIAEILGVDVAKFQIINPGDMKVGEYLVFFAE